jgi:signal transduction histidine kinase
MNPSLLTNPVVLRMAIVFIGAVVLFVIAILLMRHLRREILDGSAQPRTSVDAVDFPLAAYHGVIQRLKEQEQELQKLKQQASDKAAASQNLSDVVLSNLTSGVLLFNTAGIVRQANDAARNILGYGTTFAMHGRDLFRGISQLRKETGDIATENMDEVLASAARNGVSYRRLEADYATPAGDRRVLGLTFSPVRGAAGEPLGSACLISDLTEVTNLARQVRTREQLASLGEMSAGIAHEFKNSLATISGYAQMLKSPNDSATVQQFAGKIVDETGNLTRVVTDFLAFARPQELVSQAVDLRPMLEECARESAVDLDLAGVPSGFSLAGDPTALRQAFSNLLRNSAEAARDGVPVRVVATADSQARLARLVLRDNGHGIPPEVLPRIFVPFFTTKSSGTGIGLALVHRIVTQHGGTISVASDPQGTAFTLSFPAEKLAKSNPEQR